MTLWKRQNCGGSKKTSDCQGVGDVIGKSTENFQDSETALCYNGGHMPLYICPNPWNVQHHSKP
jgi:hypothetical protein